MWGEGTADECKSESAQCSEKQQSPYDGDGGGGLKFEKNARKQLSPHLRKKVGYRLPCNLYFFIHPQPNNIGPSTAAF